MERVSRTLRLSRGEMVMGWAGSMASAWGGRVRSFKFIVYLVSNENLWKNKRKN